MAFVKQIEPRHPVERCRLYGDRVSILLEQGNFELARKVINQAEVELSTSEDKLSSRKSLAQLLEENSEHLPARIRNRVDDRILRLVNELENQLQVIYVWQLLDLDLGSVSKLNNVGERAIELLTEGLAISGFRWPLESFRDSPVQKMIDDEYAKRLEECGFITIGALTDPGLEQRLQSNDFLPFEIARIQLALNKYLDSLPGQQD